jgi:hypothetical protein
MERAVVNFLRHGAFSFSGPEQMPPAVDRQRVIDHPPERPQATMVTPLAHRGQQLGNRDAGAQRVRRIFTGRFDLGE